MANLHQLLKAMVEKGASDLHITTGSPPQLRIDGKLVPLKTPPLNPVDTKQICYSILTDAQKHKFEEENELDLSFGVKGLSRFRANIFMQRGAVAGAFRTIPFKILTFDELGLPPIVADLAQEAARPGAGDRPDRLGQVDHAGVDHRQDQHRPARAHPHRRGPHRVPAPAQELRGEPARGGGRHPELQEGAQVHPPPGPRRGADRRDARPGDGRGGAGDLRDRPPGLRHAAHQQRGADHQPHPRRLPALPAAAGARPALLRAGGRAHPEPAAQGGRRRAACSSSR